MKTDLFQFCGHCWVFQVCWHIECSTFTASSFRIWKSSTGIPSPHLLIYVYVNLKLLVYLSPHIPEPNFCIPFSNHNFIFYVCESFAVSQISSFVSFFLDCMFKRFTIFVCLISLNMIISRSIHCCCKWHYFILLYGSLIFQCVCVWICVCHIFILSL